MTYLILFIILALSTLIAALMVITTKNPVLAVFFLILSFLSTATIILLFGVEFVPMIFIILYVGAIAILFLFVVMMLDIKLVDLVQSKYSILVLIGFLMIMFLFDLYAVLSYSEFLKANTKDYSHLIYSQMSQGEWIEITDEFRNNSSGIKPLFYELYQKFMVNYYVNNLFIKAVGTGDYSDVETIHLKIQEVSSYKLDVGTFLSQLIEDSTNFIKTTFGEDGMKHFHNMASVVKTIPNHPRTDDFLPAPPELFYQYIDLYKIVGFQSEITKYTGTDMLFNPDNFVYNVYNHINSATGLFSYSSENLEFTKNQASPIIGSLESLSEAVDNKVNAIHTTVEYVKPSYDIPNLCTDYTLVALDKNYNLLFAKNQPNMEKILNDMADLGHDNFIKHEYFNLKTKAETAEILRNKVESDIRDIMIPLNEEELRMCNGLKYMLKSSGFSPKHNNPCYMFKYFMHPRDDYFNILFRAVGYLSYDCNFPNETFELLKKTTATSIKMDQAASLARDIFNSNEHTFLGSPDVVNPENYFNYIRNSINNMIDNPNNYNSKCKTYIKDVFAPLANAASKTKIDSKYYIWDKVTVQASNIQNIGNVLYTHHALLFIVAGIILLVAMIGAIVLTLYKPVKVKRQDIFNQVTRHSNRSHYLKK